MLATSVADPPAVAPAPPRAPLPPPIPPAAAPPAAGPPPRRSRIPMRLPARRAAAWSPWLIAVGLLCVAVPVIVAALSGNLVIPHNDAWSMSRITETFARTGHIRLLGWNDMNLIGQVVMLGPLGSSLVVQQLAVAALSAACLLCVYRLLAVSLTTRNAVLGTLLLGLWPGWASLSTSFETDVPTFAATFAALLLGRRALMRDSAGWLAAAMLVSAWAVSIREQAIVAPVAILVYAWLTRRARRRLATRALCVTAGITAAAIVGFEVWRWALPLGQDPGPTAGPLRFLGDLAACGSQSYLTLAIALSPAVLIGAARHRWGRRDWPVVGLGLAMVALALLCGGVVGHYLAPSGEYSQVLPGARAVIPHGVWDALLALGCMSGALAPAVVRARWRAVDPLLGLFTVLAFAEIVGIGATGNGVSDRYLPAVVPGLIAVLLSHPGPRGHRGAAAAAWRGGAGVALACVAAVSAALALNGYAFDAARWHTAQRIARTGVAPTRIAAGMEWSGWHSPHGMIYGHAQSGRPGGWELAFSRRPACVVLSPSPLRTSTAPGESAWTPAGSASYRTFLVSGASRLYLYRTHASGCPA